MPSTALESFVRETLDLIAKSADVKLVADPVSEGLRLWWDLVGRYQQVPHPERRDEPDWATKIHVATSPVYYHKYLYGRLFSTQLTEEMNRRFGVYRQYVGPGLDKSRNVLIRVGDH